MCCAVIVPSLACWFSLILHGPWVPIFEFLVSVLFCRKQVAACSQLQHVDVVACVQLLQFGRLAAACCMLSVVLMDYMLDMVLCI
jgi:hypothetical protein